MTAFSMQTQGPGMFSELMHQTYRHQLHSFKPRSRPNSTGASLQNTTEDKEKPTSMTTEEITVCPRAAQIVLL